MWVHYACGKSGVEICDWIVRSRELVSTSTRSIVTVIYCVACSCEYVLIDISNISKPIFSHKTLGLNNMTHTGFQFSSMLRCILDVYPSLFVILNNFCRHIPKRLTGVCAVALPHLSWKIVALL